MIDPELPVDDPPPLVFASALVEPHPKDMTTDAAAMSTPEMRAIRRAASPGGLVRTAHTARTATTMRAMPEVARCANSIAVSTVPSDGINAPRHAGQLAPHPAPDSVARTTAPSNTTTTL